jgi:hypothetical protein
MRRLCDRPSHLPPRCARTSARGTETRMRNLIFALAALAGVLILASEAARSF